MTSLETIRDTTSLRNATEGQLAHLAIALLMALGAISLLEPGGTTFLGLSATGWAKLSIWLAVVHQVMVAIVFRGQLHYAMMTRLFGDADLRIWGRMFFPLLGARPLTILVVAIASAGTLPLWWPLSALAGLILFAVSAWTMHSVLTHFTLPRALGGDHFRNEYAEMPMVTEGAFAWSQNAMYSLGFLGLWGIALIFDSWNAVVVALFQHAYIWVHMYFTEEPDMRRIHG